MDMFVFSSSLCKRTTFKATESSVCSNCTWNVIKSQSTPTNLDPQAIESLCTRSPSTYIDSKQLTPIWDTKQSCKNISSGTFLQNFPTARLAHQVFVLRISMFLHSHSRPTSNFGFIWIYHFALCGLLSITSKFSCFIFLFHSNYYFSKLCTCREFESTQSLTI